MSFLLALARIIDTINEKLGLTISWALLVAVVICAGNAIMRYTFSISSNAWLEIQWYLFSAVFLFAASYTLRRNEHVRIDVVSSRLPKRTQIIIDAFGFLFFLLPMTVLTFYFSLSFVANSWEIQEMSSNAGGLIVWPVKILIPIGFALLSLQAVSEFIKRIGFLLGRIEASEFEKHVASPEHEAIAVQDLKQ